MNDSNFNNILKILEKNNLFLTGSAGTGKSFMTSKIISHYKEQGRGVVALGSTGISAVNIGGVTLHSFFAFGISKNFEELMEYDRHNKDRLSELKSLLQSTELIVIDEVSMIGVNTFEMLRYRLDRLGYNGRLMFVGDFFQLPPIPRKDDGFNTLFSKALYAFESSAWSSFAPKIVELKKVYRSSDSKFITILERVRRGVDSDEVIDYLFKLHNNTKAYNNRPTWLFGRNQEVDSMNRKSLDSLDGDEYILFANLKRNRQNINEKRLQNWLRMLPIESELRLKIGAPILFTINRWGSYINGERGILRVIEDDFLLVEKGDELIRVKPYEFVLGEPKLNKEGKLEMEPLATLEQFPIKLAYAVTIHKSQGMSIEQLVCNVDSIFAPSQFYVAISRATNPNTLAINFNRGNFIQYLNRAIRVDERVEQFYSSIKTLN